MSVQCQSADFCARSKSPRQPGSVSQDAGPGAHLSVPPFGCYPPAPMPRRRRPLAAGQRAAGGATAASGRPDRSDPIAFSSSFSRGLLHRSRSPMRCGRCGIGNAPDAPTRAFSAYQGGSLQAMFIQQWGDLQQLYGNAVNDLNTAVSDANAHATAATTQFSQTKPSKRLDRSRWANGSRGACWHERSGGSP